MPGINGRSWCWKASCWSNTGPPVSNGYSVCGSTRRSGPIVTFGLGGIYVEVLRKVGFRLAPMTTRDIDDLILESGTTPLLSGMRGRPAANLDALKSTIRTLSDVARYPSLIGRISVIEINPLTIDEHGVCALDALIMLSKKGEP